MDLEPDELEIIRASIEAAATGPFFPDWEFQTLFGLERKDLLRVVKQWPPDVVDEKVEMAVMGSLSNLSGYPHGMEKQLLARVHVDRHTISAILKKLK